MFNFQNKALISMQFYINKIQVLWFELVQQSEAQAGI